MAEPATNPAPPTISTHILDTERGVPAVGVHVTLYRLDINQTPIRMTQALTDADGRVRDLLERPLTIGSYRIEIGLGDADDPSFFTKVALDIRVDDASRSYHVPLLRSSFALTAYRGS